MDRVKQVDDARSLELNMHVLMRKMRYLKGAS
jgi:hypothetical protein